MTPKHSQLTELMHAVLDGEASDHDVRQLEQHLATDPEARAEFEEWRRLFSALAEMPKEHVPEGLVASVRAAAPAARRDDHQPFSRRRVLGDTSARPSRSVKMTQESSRRIFAHRKAWLGAGIAAAAALVVAQVAFDFPIAKDVVGTVIPAQRYRAAQNGSEQVQVGTPAGQVAPTGAAPEGGRSLAEKAAAERTESALNANQMQTGLTADRAAAELSVDRSAELRVDRSAELRVDRAAELKVDRAAELKVDRAAADMTMQRNSADKTTIDRSAQP